MSEEQQPSDDGHTPVSRAQKDDIYLVPGIVILFVLVTLKFAVGFEMHPTVVSVLLATAVSLVVYRFLGGIQSSTQFSLGAIKFGGSLAAFAGLFVLLNDSLEPDPTTIADVFPKKENLEWVPVNKVSAEPVDLKYKLPNDSGLIDTDDSVFIHHNLRIADFGNIVSKRGSGMALGTLLKEDLDQSIHTSLSFEGDIKLSGLKPYSKKYQIDTTDIYFRTRKFGKQDEALGNAKNTGYTHFEFFDAEGTQINYGAIKGRGSTVKTLLGEPYLVTIYSVAHEKTDRFDIHASFMFERIRFEHSFKSGNVTGSD